MGIAILIRLIIIILNELSFFVRYWRSVTGVCYKVWQKIVILLNLVLNWESTFSIPNAIWLINILVIIVIFLIFVIAKVLLTRIF